jgi:hypothetical protein
MAYRNPMHTFSGVSAIKIRYQTLEINDGQAQIFADVILHELLPEEYNLSLQQVISRLRPSSTRFWISKNEINNHILSCRATSCYHNIEQFKTLEEKQWAAAESGDAVIVTQNDLASISSVKDVVSVALKICPCSKAEGEAECRPSFEYHVVEDAILMMNGWECLRRVEGRYVSIEDDEWLVEQNNRLLTQYPWMSLFNAPKSLLEYGLKLLIKTADAKHSNESRRHVLTKALQGRTRLMADKDPDLGHAFCIAVLLIAIYQFRE